MHCEKIDKSMYIHYMVIIPTFVFEGDFWHMSLISEWLVHVLVSFDFLFVQLTIVF